eukprot:scaffold5125_cov156-Amphora_coffeaeformis.AAC.4
MMKLRTRAMNGLQKDDEGEGVRLDSGGEKKTRDTDASYEFTSITADPDDEGDDRARKSSTLITRRRGVRGRPSDQTSSKESSREFQLSPNTLSTRSLSTDDELDPDKAPKEETEERPRPRRGLTRGLSGRNVSGDSGRNLTRGLSARNLVMGVGSFRKTFMKDQLADEKEDQPLDVPEKRGGLFGGGRRKRDQKDDINMHIGEITISKDKLTGEVKDSKQPPAPTRKLTKTRSEKVRKPKKSSVKDKLDSHIGEITITKKPPVDSHPGETTKNPETPDAAPGSDAETGCQDSKPVTTRPLHEAVAAALGDIVEDEDPGCEVETWSAKETDAEGKDVSQDHNNVSENFSNKTKATFCSSSKNPSKSTLCFHSAHESARTGKSSHVIDAKSKTAHNPASGPLNRCNSAEYSSSSDGGDSFADVTETGDLQNEIAEEDNGRQFVFKGESKVPQIHRGPCDDTFENQDVVFQFFLEKEHPVVWIAAEEAEGPTKHLELNISFATKVVVQNKSRFRIAGLTRGATAA